MKTLRSLHIEMANYAFLALVISAITLLVSLVAQRILPPNIPLFYGQPEGEAQLAPSLYLLLPGAFSIFLLAINTGLSTLVKDEFIKKSLILASLVVSVFAGVATLKIILLIGSL